MEDVHPSSGIRQHTWHEMVAVLLGDSQGRHAAVGQHQPERGVGKFLILHKEEQHSQGSCRAADFYKFAFSALE